MKHLLCLLLVPSLLSPAAAAQAVRGDKAMYVGGTVAAIPEKQQGKMDTAGDSHLVFTWKKDKQDQKWAVPYRNFTKMEYGQKAGRRVGAAVVVSPLFLFSKKRKHYLTMHFADETGRSQATVFELAKGTYQQTIAALEAKTGLKTEYETEEVKKEK